MKKQLVITLAALLFGAGVAFGQNGGLEFGIGLGPSFYDHTYGKSEIGLSAETNDGGFHAKYEPNRLPTFFGYVGYNLNETPLGIFVNVGWNHAWNNMDGGPSLLKETEDIYHVVPAARAYYYRKNKIALFASIGLDIRYRRFAEAYRGTTCTNHDLDFHYQIAPFNISIGKHWFVTFEFGFGSLWSAAAFSTGFRF